MERKGEKGEGRSREGRKERGRGGTSTTSQDVYHAFLLCTTPTSHAFALGPM
jgi:hypothetical protein